MKVLDEFLEPHQEPGVTEEEFAAFEAAYGVTLPEDMKNFYRKRNGGRFKGTDVIAGEEHALYLEFFHPIARLTLGEHFLTINTLLQWQQMDKFLPDTLVPFCTDAGDDSYYIQADGQDNRVYYIFHEDIDEFLDTPENCLVADSFTDFLEKIHRRSSEN